MVVFRNVIFGWRNGSASTKAVISDSRGRPNAISANVKVIAVVALQIRSNVLLAGRINEAGVICELIGKRRITAVAWAACKTVNKNLRAQVKWSCSFESVLDIESVSERGSNCVSPAGATVLRNMLVLVPAQVVSAVHIPPVYFFWNWNVLSPCGRSLYLLSQTKSSFGNSSYSLRL